MPQPTPTVAPAFDPFDGGAVRFYEYLGSRWEADEALNLDGLAALDEVAAALTKVQRDLEALAQRPGIGKAAGAISAAAADLASIYREYLRGEHGRQTEAAAWLTAEAW